MNHKAKAILSTPKHCLNSTRAPSLVSNTDAVTLSVPPPQNVSVAVVGTGEDLVIYEDDKVQPFVSTIHNQALNMCNYSVTWWNNITKFSCETSSWSHTSVCVFSHLVTMAILQYEFSLTFDPSWTH